MQATWGRAPAVVFNGAASASSLIVLTGRHASAGINGITCGNANFVTKPSSDFGQISHEPTLSSNAT